MVETTLMHIEDIEGIQGD